MPIRRSPNGVRHTRPQPGRDRPEWVVAINRNDWSQSIVVGGRNPPVRPSKLAIIAIAGMLALAATADIAALEWSIGFQKSMQALISLALLGASMIAIVSEKYADKDRNWSYGTVGALIGFWLHVT